MKKRKWEIETLSEEALHANNVVRQKQEELEILLDQICETEIKIRVTINVDTAFKRKDYQDLCRFLKFLRHKLDIKQQELNQANKVYEDIQTKLIESMKVIKGLEKHKADKQQEHDSDLLHAELKEADSQWLSRR